MTNSLERQQALKDALANRVLVLDGAMGTMIHAAPLSIETDYQGRENCPEILNVTRPDVIQDIHRQYLEAGADIIETNTFGGTRIALADNKLDDRAYEFNFAAARLPKVRSGILQRV
jgi:5-methyltetrahydrofolate--homocysteine methyltransferase